MDTQAGKRPVPLIPNGSFPQRVEEETQSDLANFSVHGKERMVIRMEVGWLKSRSLHVRYIIIVYSV